MLRAMILTLVMILITFSAYQLGQDEQLVKVLGLTKVPISQSTTPQETNDADAKARENSPYIPPAPPASSSSQISSRPPRFILDESVSVDPVIEEFPHSENSDFESYIDPSAAEILDPSGEEKNNSYEQISEITIKIPTEEEKLASAQPYIKELTALLSSFKNHLEDLSDDILEEYLSIPPGSRSNELAALVVKYKPQISQAIDKFDRQAENIFNKTTAALAAIGADDSITNDARNAYERDKTSSLEHYYNIFAQLEQS